MGTLDKTTFGFLKDVAANNNRDWFNLNKPRYELARANTLEFIQHICDALPGIDPGVPELKAEKVMMRIYRDVRFSLDKSPYKTHFAAGLSPNGKMANEPGYFLSFAPDGTDSGSYGSCFIAAGYWMPNASDLHSIRQEIDYNAGSLSRILNKPSFKSLFPELSAEGKLKKAPKNYPADHEHIEWLKHKSFVVIAKLNEKLLTGPVGVKTILENIKEAAPFVSYLRDACQNTRV